MAVKFQSCRVDEHVILRFLGSLLSIYACPNALHRDPVMLWKVVEARQHVLQSFHRADVEVFDNLGDVRQEPCEFGLPG